MSRRETSPQRLLLVPALLLVTLIVGIQLLEQGSPRSMDPSLVVDAPSPESEVEVRRCRREGDPQAVVDARSELGEQPLVTSARVVACPAAFEGLSVRYVGELVGDLLPREGGAWVLVNDDDYALEVGPLPAHRDHRGINEGLTVWLPEELQARVTGLGRPNQRGDVVELEGRIERTDPADGGGLTLRAARMEILAAATTVEEPLAVPQLLFTVAMGLIAGLLWSLRRRAARR